MFKFLFNSNELFHRHWRDEGGKLSLAQGKERLWGKKHRLMLTCFRNLDCVMLWHDEFICLEVLTFLPCTSVKMMICLACLGINCCWVQWNLYACIITGLWSKSGETQFGYYQNWALSTFFPPDFQRKDVVFLDKYIIVLPDLFFLVLFLFLNVLFFLTNF